MNRLVNSTVTVVISTRNRQETLAKALNSVLTQTYQSLNIIAINDCSTDATAEILNRYSAQHNVQIITNSSQLGLPASLNLGISHCDTEFIARIDDDDYWTDPEKIQRQVRFMNTYSDCAVVGSAYIDENGHQVSNPLTDKTIRQQILFRCPFCHSSTLIRKSAFDAVNGYDATLPYAEDWDLWLRLGETYQLANLPEVMLTKCQGNATLSSRFFTEQLKIAHKLANKYGSHYPARYLAKSYHLVASVFFHVITPGSKIHFIAQKLFQKRFSTHKNN